MTNLLRGDANRARRGPDVTVGTRARSLHASADVYPDASSPAQEVWRELGQTEPAALEVLVVDDHPATRAGLAKAVRSFGYACREAADGNEAWTMLVERGADVVISDWQMPGMTGLELCRRARTAFADGRYTYFILVTGFHDRERLMEGMAAGADDFQKKPIDLDELEARLVSANRVVTLHRRLGSQRRKLARSSATHYAASRTDSLTGVGNRLRMDEDLAGAYARARRYRRRYSVAILDVDRFKHYNDTFGHVAGDVALRKIAATIVDHVRCGDSVYRYGGEELVVLLPEQSLADATAAVERIRAAVEHIGIAGPSSVVTISAGIAELDLKLDDRVESWLGRADAALYAAKAAGRNNVCASRPGWK